MSEQPNEWEKDVQDPEFKVVVCTAENQSPEFKKDKFDCSINGRQYFDWIGESLGVCLVGLNCDTPEKRQVSKRRYREFMDAKFDDKVAKTNMRDFVRNDALENNCTEIWIFLTFQEVVEPPILFDWITDAHTMIVETPFPSYPGVIAGSVQCLQKSMSLLWNSDGWVGQWQRYEKSDQEALAKAAEAAAALEARRKRYLAHRSPLSGARFLPTMNKPHDLVRIPKAIAPGLKTHLRSKPKLMERETRHSNYSMDECGDGGILTWKEQCDGIDGGDGSSVLLRDPPTES